MPFVDVRISKIVSCEQKEMFKTQLGKAINVIPNKTESMLMIDIADGRELFFRGEKLQNGAYIKVNLYKEAPYEAKELLVKCIFEICGDIFGFGIDDIYISVDEFSNWGARGMWL